MLPLFGRDYDEAQLSHYFGDHACVCGLRRFTLREGRSRGTDITEVRTASGLSLEINESRGMDLGRCLFQGLPVAFESCTREVAPSFAELAGDGWLRSFSGGLLVTGGLSSMGAPGPDGCELLPLHGRISHTPAERVNVWDDVEDGVRWYRVRGLVREAKTLQQHLTLERTVSLNDASRTIMIDDTVRNLGFEPAEIMVLYHFNIGHPILDEGSTLIARSASITPRDEVARTRTEAVASYPGPTAGYPDTVYYHELEERDGICTAGIANDRIELGVAVSFAKNELPCFTQWKFCGQGNYVAGIEPGTAYVSGRAVEREHGRVIKLGPREAMQFHLGIDVLSGHEEIDACRQRVLR